VVAVELVMAFLPKLIASHHGFFKLEDLNLSWRKPREQQLGHYDALGYQIEKEHVEFQHQ
jgi:hypothetical protein